MKRVLLLLGFFVAAIAISAQGHIEFSGLTIEGSMADFCKMMKNKGFRPVEYEDNNVIFSGKYLGSEARIGVMSDETGDNVNGVMVLFPEYDSRETLQKNYKFYQGLLTEKYGNPTISTEFDWESIRVNELIKEALKDDSMSDISIYLLGQNAVILCTVTEEITNRERLTVIFIADNSADTEWR